MELQNAFIGLPARPTPGQIAEALGPAAALWTQLMDRLASEHKITDEEWKPVYPHKYGWSARMKLKKRTILYMGPCKNSFRVSFVLGDKAIAAARASKLPKIVLEVIDSARRYAEGTGVVLQVKKESDLKPILKLVEIKLAN